MLSIILQAEKLKREIKEN